MTKFYNLTEGPETAELMIFGDITSAPFLDSDVDAHSIVNEINAVTAGTIEVHINSYGGECSEALAIVNALQRHPARVVTYNDGFACSAAATVFMAGDERVAARYSTFLFHPAWAEVTGNADDLRREAANLDTITKQSKELYLAKTALTPEELDRLMAEERFLSPEEAELLGFATRIEGEPGGSARQSVFRRFMAAVPIDRVLEAAEEPEEPEEPEDQEDQEEPEEPEESEDQEEPEEPEESEDQEEPEGKARQAVNPFAKFIKMERV